MASLRKVERTGVWQVRFYWDGEQRQRSCATKSHARAERIQSMIEETLHLLKTGRLEIPSEVDPIKWILSGGKIQSTPTQKSKVTQKQFGRLCAEYYEEQKQKALSTLSGEKIHIGHLKRILGSSRAIESFDIDTLRAYCKQRSRQKHNGKYISDATIKKELVTFRQIWIWAKQNNYVAFACPLLDENGRWKIAFEKPDSRGKFQTWDQIIRRIVRGGLSEDEVSELWEGLFLDNGQVCELLKHVKDSARHPFIYPMFCFAAYTGVRRSEILRSEVEDFDFDNGQILIRECKRRKDRRGSTRLVPLHPTLRSIMQQWLESHPGGRYTIAPPLHMPYRKKDAKRNDYLTPGQADDHFDRVLSKSKWDVVRGFHVLRHSFGSNLVRTGKVSSDVVGKWMGHTTEEMRELYQHLFPQDGQQQIAVLR